MVSMNIKHYRIKEGYTQQQLADLLGVSKNTVYEWEKNKRMPERKYIDAMCNTFAISEYDFFCRRDTNDSLSRAIDRLYQLPEHMQYKVIGLISELWLEMKP